MARRRARTWGVGIRAGDLIPSFTQHWKDLHLHLADRRRFGSARAISIHGSACKLDRVQARRYGGAMRRAWAVVLVAVAAGAAHSPARVRAAEVTDVASAFDEDNPFDFRFRVSYRHSEKRAQIKRELEGISPTQSQIAVLRDLAYARRQDTMSLRAEFGIFQDLQLHAELPIIFGDTESYSFDQSEGGNCRYPPDPNPNCVNGSNSSTVADGLVPASGFDATHSGASIGAPTLFRGVDRGAIGGGGLDSFDTFNFGLTWAPVSQKRDDTKPTWILALEPQISIGNIKAFDRQRPSANHAVSEGIHRIVARTAISHRWRWVDPYIGFWYMYPVARGDSLFKDYGPSQKVKNPMQQGGTVFGVELVPFEKPRDGHKIAIDLRGRIEGHFSGRGYSEIWELLASSPALACDNTHADFNPACNSGATTNAYQGQPFTGVTTIENYATLGTDFSLDVQVGRHARFRTSFLYTHDQSHLVTGEDIGVPSTASGRVMTAPEFNPAYRAVIDQVGRRYKVDNVDVFDFQIWGQLQF
jgi:hypothetical protein